VANVFVVRDGRLLTPLATDGALEGITRRTILELAQREGIPAAERTLGRFDLLDAEEVFLTGTGAGIVPVASLDGPPGGRGAPGARPVTTRLAAAFAAFARSAGVPFDAAAPASAGGALAAARRGRSR
jgi:branched-chain amino acid aminotransferase